MSITEILAIVSPIISVAFACGVSNQKIKALEKTVDKHNKFAERLPIVETKIEVLEREINEIREEV